ncbi:MAG: type VI secretion system-associated protein TagF [Geminicoccaceae bacterium]
MSGSGFFGKIPSHGDFVRRSLSPAFVTPWDGWLQAGLAKARETLGDQWLDIYLTSPVWRFALASGFAGNAAAAGLFIPSVDRVGRYFPFTLASVIDAAPSPFDIRCGAGDWFTSAEPLALSVLAEDFSFDDLVDRLDRLAMPALADDDAVRSGAWRFDGDDGVLLLQHLGRMLALPYGLFWTEGSRVVPPTTLLTRRMPTPRQFTALLDGAWAAHGWEEVAS